MGNITTRPQPEAPRQPQQQQQQQAPPARDDEMPVGVEGADGNERPGMCAIGWAARSFDKHTNECMLCRFHGLSFSSVDSEYKRTHLNKQHKVYNEAYCEKVYHEVFKSLLPAGAARDAYDARRRLLDEYERLASAQSRLAFFRGNEAVLRSAAEARILSADVPQQPPKGLVARRLFQLHLAADRDLAKLPVTMGECCYFQLISNIYAEDSRGFAQVCDLVTGAAIENGDDYRGGRCVCIACVHLHIVNPYRNERFVRHIINGVFGHSGFVLGHSNIESPADLFKLAASVYRPRLRDPCDALAPKDCSCATITDCITHEQHRRGRNPAAAAVTQQHLAALSGQRVLAVRQACSHARIFSIDATTTTFAALSFLVNSLSSTIGLVRDGSEFDVYKLGISNLDAINTRAIYGHVEIKDGALRDDANAGKIVALLKDCNIMGIIWTGKLISLGLAEAHISDIVFSSHADPQHASDATRRLAWLSEICGNYCCGTSDGGSPIFSGHRSTHRSKRRSMTDDGSPTTPRSSRFGFMDGPCGPTHRANGVYIVRLRNDVPKRGTPAYQKLCAQVIAAAAADADASATRRSLTTAAATAASRRAYSKRRRAAPKQKRRRRTGEADVDDDDDGDDGGDGSVDEEGSDDDVSDVEQSGDDEGSVDGRDSDDDARAGEDDAQTANRTWELTATTDGPIAICIVEKKLPPHHSSPQQQEVFQRASHIRVVKNEQDSFTIFVVAAWLRDPMHKFRFVLALSAIALKRFQPVVDSNLPRKRGVTIRPIEVRALSSEYHHSIRNGTGILAKVFEVSEQSVRDEPGLVSDVVELEENLSNLFIRSNDRGARRRRILDHATSYINAQSHEEITEDAICAALAGFDEVARAKDVNLAVERAEFERQLRGIQERARREVRNVAAQIAAPPPDFTEFVHDVMQQTMDLQDHPSAVPRALEQLLDGKLLVPASDVRVAGQRGGGGSQGGGGSSSSSSGGNSSSGGGGAPAGAAVADPDVAPVVAPFAVGVGGVAVAGPAGAAVAAGVAGGMMPPVVVLRCLPGGVQGWMRLRVSFVDLRGHAASYVGPVEIVLLSAAGGPGAWPGSPHWDVFVAAAAGSRYVGWGAIKNPPGTGPARGAVYMSTPWNDPAIRTSPPNPRPAACPDDIILIEFACANIFGVGLPRRMMDAVLSDTPFPASHVGGVPPGAVTTPAVVDSGPAAFPPGVPFVSYTDVVPFWMGLFAIYNALPWWAGGW